MLENNYNTQMLWMKIYINTRYQEYVFANAPMMESLEDNASKFQDLLNYTLAGLDLADKDDREELFVKNYVKELCDEWPDCFEESQYTFTGRQNLYMEYKTWMRTWGLRNCSKEYGWFQDQIIAWMTKQLKLETEEMQRKQLEAHPAAERDQHDEEVVQVANPADTLRAENRAEWHIIEELRETLQELLFDGEKIFKKMRPSKGYKFRDTDVYVNYNGNTAFHFDLEKRTAEPFEVPIDEEIISFCGNNFNGFYLTDTHSSMHAQPFYLYTPQMHEGVLVDYEDHYLDHDYMKGPFLCKNIENGVVVVGKDLHKPQYFANLYEVTETNELKLTKTWENFTTSNEIVLSCTYNRKYDMLVLETTSKVNFIFQEAAMRSNFKQGKMQSHSVEIKKPDLAAGQLNYSIDKEKHEISLPSGDGESFEIASEQPIDSSTSCYIIDDALNAELMDNKFSLMFCLEAGAHLVSASGQINYEAEYADFKRTTPYLMYIKEDYKQYKKKKKRGAK
jgi:hypothetical protein